jgi:glycogen(starch) synthase
MKVFAALGPGDIVGAHRRQITNQSVESETSIIYSGQLLEYCRNRNIEVLALSQNDRTDALIDGGIQVENRPIFLGNSNGITFHISRVLRGLYLAYRAKRFGADFALINSGSAHYFSLSSFALLGIPVAVDFHNTLWPTGFPETGILKRIIRKLDALHFRWFSAGTIGVSEECGRQVLEIAGSEVPFFDYKCQFRPTEFLQASSRLPMEDGVFRVAFVGRLEGNKGAFDLISIAEIVKMHPVKMEVCGGGPALAELQKEVQDRGLGEVITIHGPLIRSSLLDVYRNSDAVIIPTRSDFAEGMPKVCAEAALCNLPIITSRLSNAFDSLAPAIIEAKPNDPESYAAAILTLVADPDRYNDMKAACAVLTRPFLDRSSSLAAAFDRLLSVTLQGWKPLDSFNAVFARVV